MSAHSDRVLERLTRLHPKVIDLELGRTERLLAALGHPERRLPPVIHVAGTNGKGSTIAMIRAGLESTGARVHVYTSPHLARFHERIRIAGELISEDRLLDCLERCEAANGDVPITFFEVTTAAAFLAMAETPADWTLLEVGLGGEFDATNVIERPRLSVITPVSVDHQQYLGETLPEIAAAKAGILKRGCLGIIARQPAEALEVIEARAARMLAPLMVEGQDWQVWEEHGRVAFLDPQGLLDLPLPRLIGAHQVENAGTAVAALRALGMDETACLAALAEAEWPARMQRLRTGPLVDAAAGAEVWLDGGHNPAAGVALAEALGRLPGRPVHLVVGMLRTKDAAGFLRPLEPVARSLQGVTIEGEAATLSAAETVAAARAAGFAAAHEAAGVEAAIRAIVADAPDCRIVICGSLYLAGRVLRENG
ncbi:dihydrofolate synthase/folylpolyglutamate synthase [Amaricoccus macauensis]|uniref:Dihydrofolate synthase/folylpolyglutamate synthase n=1 Tax=Amaricoccus macauensis TaxID=57001 RepID=A0A840SNF7_9RHOB|nr:folylpolyglutamate synthase/dihydrofolate synthase family protein [Amaricoccus macauensis]MBB5223537.1 dihydrofolate synthase/folylpolyglutamate synthase [Amaricoccus macauensis]